MRGAIFRQINASKPRSTARLKKNILKCSKLFIYFVKYIFYYLIVVINLQLWRSNYNLMFVRVLTRTKTLKYNNASMQRESLKVWRSNSKCQKKEHFLQLTSCMMILIFLYFLVFSIFKLLVVVPTSTYQY